MVFDSLDQHAHMRGRTRTVKFLYENLQLELCNMMTLYLQIVMHWRIVVIHAERPGLVRCYPKLSLGSWRIHAPLHGI